MNIYVASSWRNDRQPAVVQMLREAGYGVYDFRNPRPGDAGFHWSEIDENWQEWTPDDYREALNHPIAIAGFDSDMAALRRCDAVVAVQPFGRSASLELGWACGAGKFTVLLLDKGEPELMAAMCDCLCLSVDEAIDRLYQWEENHGDV